MMTCDFVRAHGLGNDYLVMDAARLAGELTAEQVRQICDRHWGVGSDGILLKVPGQGADFGLRILNPDGSEAEKSGNGLRIFAKFLFDHGYTSKADFSISTLGGVVRAQLVLENGRCGAVRVEMGRAVIDRQRTTLEVEGKTLSVTVLSVGNPHCVVVVPDLKGVDLARLGPAIERHPVFPNRTNVQFAQVESRRDVQALIWERGAGHTLASGSSACAVAVACFDGGVVDREVTVHMEGGDLRIEVREGLELVMTGPVEEVCTGNFSREFLQRVGLTMRR